MSGFFDNVATPIAPLHDVLLVVLGSPVSLLGTLLVQHRRAKDELRVKILASTVDRLTEVEERVALICTWAGVGTLLGGLEIGRPQSEVPMPSRNEMHDACSRSVVLTNALHRYPRLTTSLMGLTSTTETILSRRARPELPKEDEKSVIRQQLEVEALTFRVQRRIDQIVDTDLRTDMTLPERIRGIVRSFIRGLPFKRVHGSGNKQASDA